MFGNIIYNYLAFTSTYDSAIKAVFCLAKKSASFNETYQIILEAKTVHIKSKHQLQQTKPQRPARQTLAAANDRAVSDDI